MNPHVAVVLVMVVFSACVLMVIGRPSIRSAEIGVTVVPEITTDCAASGVTVVMNDGRTFHNVINSEQFVSGTIGITQVDVSGDGCDRTYLLTPDPSDYHKTVVVGTIETCNTKRGV